MKSILAAVLAVMMVAPVANAQRADRRNQQPRRAEQVHRSNDDRREEAIVAGVLGGIISLIGADRIDNDGRGRYNDGRYGRDNYGRNRTLFCFAESRRGELFRARGQSAQIAQAKALNKCYQSSRMCRPAGCQY